MKRKDRGKRNNKFHLRNLCVGLQFELFSSRGTLEVGRRRRAPPAFFLRHLVRKMHKRRQGITAHKTTATGGSSHNRNSRSLGRFDSPSHNKVIRFQHAFRILLNPNLMSGINNWYISARVTFCKLVFETVWMIISPLQRTSIMILRYTVACVSPETCRTRLEGETSR